MRNKKQLGHGESIRDIHFSPHLAISLHLHLSHVLKIQRYETDCCTLIRNNDSIFNSLYLWKLAPKILMRLTETIVDIVINEFCSVENSSPQCATQLFRIHIHAHFSMLSFTTCCTRVLWMSVKLFSNPDKWRMMQSETWPVQKKIKIRLKRNLRKIVIGFNSYLNTIVWQTSPLLRSCFSFPSTKPPKPTHFSASLTARASHQALKPCLESSFGRKRSKAMHQCAEPKNASSFQREVILSPNF